MAEKKQGIHRIAVLSDTHSLLRPEIKQVLKGCEVILHGGDIASSMTYDELDAIAPAYFVRGNADEEWSKEAWTQEEREANLPLERDLELYGFHFYMTHKKKDIRQDLSGVDIVIYGHSHKYAENTEGGTLYLNPGSCGPRRFTQPITMAVITVDEGEHDYTVERIDLQPESKSGDKELPDAARDMDKLIRAIMKDMKANRTVDRIAGRNKVSVEFVNQILQIYTTHPGIDVDGILNRMDILGK